MKLYQPHRDLLFVLFHFELRQGPKPVLCSEALGIINEWRSNPYAASNFRVGCGKMVAAGLLNQYRSRSLKLAYTLTEEGRVLAEIEYRDRTQEQADER